MKLRALLLAVLCGIAATVLVPASPAHAGSGIDAAPSRAPA